MPKEDKQQKNHRFHPREIKEAFLVLLHFHRYIRRYWKAQVILFILGSFYLVFSLINPYLGKIILDNGILGKDLGLFIKYTLLAGAVFVLRWAVDHANIYFKNYAVRKIKINLAKSVFRKISKLSLSFFNSRHSSEFVFLVERDISGCANIIANTLPNIILALLRLASITAIIIFIDYRILFLVLGYQVYLIFQEKFLIRKRQELARADAVKSQNMFKVLGEFFSHMYLVKVSGTAYEMIRRYFRQLAGNTRLEIKLERLTLVSDFLLTSADKLFFGLTGLVGSFLIIKGRLSLGSFSAIMMYLSQGIGDYAQIFYSLRQVILNRITLEKFEELLGAEIEVKEKPDAKDIVFARGSIEFRNVSFGYQKDRPVLEDLSFSIPGEAKVAIVGHSGRGKSTALNLILRLYDVDTGAILLDGQDLRDLKFKSLYDQISIAPQEPFLWNETVGYNIRYGKRNAERREAIPAAKISCAHEFIANLAYNYETMIEENGRNFSQGQKQRLAIARAVIKKPKILILDEAASSLDSETEDKIIGNIRREFIDSTVIVVSHRLSTAKKMDLVYFLESPSCMQVGTHQELVERSVKYKELFASQIEAEIEPQGIGALRGIRD